MGKLAGACLHVVKQPHLLDRDHRLVGEGLQALDLSVREQPGLSAGDRNRAYGNAVAQYRDTYDTAKAADSRHSTEREVRVCVDIRDLNDASLEHRASRGGSPTWRRRKRASVHLEQVGGEAVVRHEVEELAVEPVDKAELGLAEPPRALGDHVEDRLDVRERATRSEERRVGKECT